jgi:single-stranded-DNA-specific exonuclease
MSFFPLPREEIVLRPVDDATVQRLAGELQVSPLLARILVARNLTTFDQCKRFFRPAEDQFHDPFLLPQMRQAVDRIRQALDQNEKITVYGDYDVDGITSTATLVQFLRRRGVSCDYYLPNRLTEGYGMSADGIDEINRRGSKLIVTVDCGITGQEAVGRAAGYGIDVIVTDHHEPHGTLPSAFAIVNPKVGDYPDKGLAGVGVVLKLTQALCAALSLDRDEWFYSLDLVALGTAADIVPLLGENRVIAKLGFEMLTVTKNLGLQELIAVQNMTGKRLTTSDVVFQLAPCINAVGRLGDPTAGLELLLTQDHGKAAAYARELWQTNRDRRALDSDLQEQAIGWVKANCDPLNDFAIVAANEGWHAGVLGIVASKLVERFCRPSFLFTIGEDGVAKGSGRSVSGLNLLEAMNRCSDLMISYGGHAAAAGASIRKENLAEFRSRFNAAVQSLLSPGDLIPKVHVDAEARLASLTPKFFNIIKQMEPFGPGNMRPVLLCRNVKNRVDPRVVGNKHLKLSLTSEGVVMDAIAFNLGDRLAEVRGSRPYAVAFCLDENEWNGQVNLQMKVKGVSV